MTRKSIFSKTLILAISMTTLAACGQSVGTAGLNDQVHRNTVQLVRFSHVIKAEDDKTATLSAKTMSSLNVFLANSNVGYGDVLMVDSTYSAEDDRVSEISTMLKKRGLTYAGKTFLGAKPDEGDVVLYLERHVVTTPTCGNWPDEIGNNRKNNPSSYHGCSNVANLGLMVANPRDLVSGTTTGNSTGAAVGAIIGAPQASPPAGTGTQTLTITNADGNSVSFSGSANDSSN